jgi:chromosome segregation ATPase
MLGTIEELEKDIEKFQKNVAASEELQTLLKQTLEEIRNQNSDFNAQSTVLVSRVDNLPATIENANISSNNRVKNDVASEVDRALQSFTDNQSRYLQGLEQTKQQIQRYIEQAKSLEGTVTDTTSEAIAKVSETPSTIEAANARSNEQIQNDVRKELENALGKFADEQEKYLQSIESMRQQIQTYLEEIKNQKKEFSEETAAVLAKWDTVLESVVTENHNTNMELKGDMDRLLSEKVAEFSIEQGKYIDELRKTQESLQDCESQLNVKYKEFIGTLEKMNISNIYEQNVQLKAEIDKRTTILMVISIISIVVGVLGIIF